VLAWAALAELVPLYPLYALLFLASGVSEAGVSALFALWSAVAVLTEVPAGLLADRWSRRGCLVLAALLQAAGFALWTAAPVAPSFAAGFVLWGLGGSLVSGSAEALVHDGLAAAGAPGSVGRLWGAVTAAGLVVQVPTALLATALSALGGSAAAGWASVAVLLLTAVLAARLPDVRLSGTGGPADDVPAVPLRAVLRGRPAALWAVVAAVAFVGGLDALEEYTPVMAAGWGVPTAVVPVALLGVPLLGAAGAWAGGRLSGPRAAGVLTTTAAGAFAVATLLDRPAAVVLLALGYGAYRAVLVVVEARLQAEITGDARATLTSVAGVGAEVSAFLVYGGWAVGGTWGIAALLALAVPLVVPALRRRERRAALR
jgi:MFS family permease